MKWQETELGELINIRHGWAFKGGYFSDTPTRDILITPGNFHVGGGFKADKLKYYNGIYPNSYILNAGDIVVTMTDLSKEADTIGYAAKVPIIEGCNMLLNQRIGQVLPKSNDFNLHFIYWVMRSYNYQRYVANASRGSTVKHTSPTLIKQYRFSLPPLPIQNLIVSVLSAYDDLIENNLRRIKLLEQAAKCEYELLMRKGNNTMIAINDLAQTLGGGTPSTKDLKLWNDGDVVWFSPTDLTKNNSLVQIDSSKKITIAGLKNSSARLFPPYTLMMTSRATIGHISMTDKPASTNQGFINIIPFEEVHRYIILFNLLGRKEELIANASGSTFLEVPKTLFRKLTISIPKDTEAVSDFHQSTHRKIELILNLQTQIIELRKARDILLPKLMSGQIDVSKLQSSSKFIPLQSPVVSMVAEEQSLYQPKQPKAGAKYYFRTLLAAYIVNSLWQERTFGHVKLVKLMYLSEHVAHIETISNYHRDAAGPYDNQMIRSIDKQLKEKKWFEMYKKDGKYPKYRPLEKVTGFMADFTKYHGDKQAGIDSLIKIFGAISTEQVEMAATVYEAWRYLKEHNQTISKEAILNEILNLWHESKTRIDKTRWINCYQWLLEKEWITLQ